MRALIRQLILDSMAEPVPEYTPRDIWIPHVANKAVTVTGIRRSGKTTFRWQLLAEHMKAGHPRESFLYFLFADDRLAELKAADLSLILDEYFNLYPELDDNRNVTFFLDEIQDIDGWEAFARRLVESRKICLYLSGSSAKLLSRDIHTSMRGRSLEANMHPFSFREYLRHHSMEPDVEPDKWTSATRARLQKAVRGYMLEGGFPEAQGTLQRDRFALLQGYVGLVLLRDVIERYKVTNPTALKWMTQQLLASPAGSFSINKFNKDLHSQGIQVSKDILHQYLVHLEDAFLFNAVTIHSGSAKRRQVNPRKVYPADTGLIPVFCRDEKPGIGHILETMVYLELKRRGAEISYVNTENGYEVDFHAHVPGKKAQLIQVCVSLADPDTRKREIRALEDAGKKIRSASQLIITLEKTRDTDNAGKIRIVPVTDWLLEPLA